MRIFATKWHFSLILNVWILFLPLFHDSQSFLLGKAIAIIRRKEKAWSFSPILLWYIHICIYIFDCTISPGPIVFHFLWNERRCFHHLCKVSREGRISSWSVKKLRFAQLYANESIQCKGVEERDSRWRNGGTGREGMHFHLRGLSDWSCYLYLSKTTN